MMLFYDLPLELVIRILSSATTLSDLRAVACTSRRVYSIFLGEKTALIYQALSHELGPVPTDALALSNIQILDASSSSYHSQVR